MIFHELRQQTDSSSLLFNKMVISDERLLQKVRHALVALLATVLFVALMFPGVCDAQHVDYFSLRSIRETDPDDACGQSVDFEATVTFVDGMREFIFVQDGHDAIFVHKPDFSSVNLGQRVRVRGRLTKGDLLPVISSPIVTVVGDGSLPVPEKVSRIGVEHDCRYLTFEFDILQTSLTASKITLFARTKSNKEVCIEIPNFEGITLPCVSQFAGMRVRCKGVLGLQMEGGFYREPGDNSNKIEGYKIFCASPEFLKVLSGRDENCEPSSAQVVGLSFLDQDSVPQGRFVTFAQVCLIDHSEPRGFVISDGYTFKHFSLHSTLDLQPGLLVRVGGSKSSSLNGQSQFKIDYLHHLTISDFPLLDPVSVRQAVQTFTPNRRIVVEGKPLRVEDRDDGPYLILGEGDSTVAVQFQDAALDTLSSVTPEIARRVRITGVSRPDDRCAFKLVVVRPDDVSLVEAGTSLSRIVQIGLWGLLGFGALAALWICMLRSQVSQKQRFESIFDSAGCPIIVFNGRLDIDDGNQVAADLTGHSKAALRNMSISDIDKKMVPEEVKSMLLQVMRTGEVAVFRTEVFTRDEQRIDVEVHSRILTPSEDPEKAKYIAVFTDITARNQHEKDLELARDEAIEANKAKSRFLASMSHELRTPLNGVIGMTQLLERTELTPTQADYLGACRTSGETLLTVIGDVLDFSKMEAGKLELNPEETELIPFIEHIVRATSLQRATRHVDLASFVDPMLSRSVLVDSDRFRQVLFNLIGNAAKFTNRGSITVTAKCFEATQDYAKVRFVVADTGIGIPEDRIESLFEAFEQCDSSTTRQYGGTGLGLTICKQIVDLMGGQIHVKSEEGQGSQFIVDVCLPFVESEKSKTDDSRRTVPDYQRLAVVGMSEPISKMLRQMFEEFHVTASFFQGNEVLAVNEFDMVLLNTNGDPETVVQFMGSQSVFDAGNAPVLVPVVPANCFVDADEWEIEGTQQPMCKPLSQTHISDLLYSRSDAAEQPVIELSPMVGLEDRPLRVLICEDIPVNQMFAKEVCSRAGIDFMVCDNGRQGIETLLQDPQFDVIFMDCHMPVMDGFEAVKIVRHMNESGLIPEIPVVALTASALAGDREKCLAAGMDDYLSKPFEFDDFLEKIRMHSKLPPAIEQKACDDAETESESFVFDFEGLVSRVSDREFAFSIAEQFAASLPQYVLDLQNCLDEQDDQKALVIAHSLKGAAGMVRAERISEVAAEIESAASSGRLELSKIQFEQILKEFNDFVQALRQESLAEV